MRLIIILLICCYFKAEAQTSALKVADSLFQYGKYSEAIQNYKEENSTEYTFTKIAESYAALGNYSKAKSNYKLVLEINPKNELVGYQLAKIFTLTKDYIKAKEQYLSLIDLDYKNPNYHYQLGLIYITLNDEFSAQSRFFSAYELDKSNQNNLYQLAKYHFKKNNETTFFKYLNEGLAAYPDNKALISLKGQHAYNADNYKKALLQFEKLLNLNEATEFVFEKLSLCHEKLYQDKKAIDYLEKALALNKTNSNYLLRLGKLHARLEQFSKSQYYYEFFLKQQDVSLESEYAALAMTLSRQKRYADAIKAYKNALRFNPKSERIKFLIVIVKTEYYKDYDSKIEAIETFKKQYPKSVFLPMLEHKYSELKKEKFHNGE